MANFRILSFDGGGIRGVLTAVPLNRLYNCVPRIACRIGPTITP